MSQLCECGKKATWMYMPRGNVACDTCVPRGCSCNAELKEGIEWDSPEAQLPQNWEEPMDEKGRKYPCCEWMYFEEGFGDTEGPIDMLYQSYEDALADGRVLTIAKECDEQAPRG